MTTSSQSLVQAFDSFHGSIYDLTRRQRIGGDSLRAACDSLLGKPWMKHLRPGEPVIFCLSNGPLFFSALIALLKVGSSPILMHGDSTIAEILRMASNYGVRYALTPAGWKKTTNEGMVRMENLHGKEGCALWHLADIEPRSIPALAGITLHPTSGTTGSPKLAVRPSACAVAEGLNYIQTIGIGGRDTILCTTPLSHAYAFGMCFVVSLLTSANIATMARFSPRLALRSTKEQGITMLQAVPAMYDVFLRVWPSGTQVPRHAFSAGAPLSEESARRFAAQSGVFIRSLYGTTETGGISLASGSLSDGVGIPMNGVEAKLRPLDEKAYGKAMAMLLIRSPSMMSGYLHKDGVDDVMIRDGWFETGDLAECDSSGAIHLQGRETDFISIFGMKVDPVEVENVIAGHEKVEEVKVYGGKHSSGSQAVFASLVGLNGFSDAEEIRRHCLSQLTAYKCPHKIHFLPALPRSASGKILRSELPGVMVTS